MWQDKVIQLSTDFGRLVGEVSSLRFVAAGITILSAEVSSEKVRKGKCTDVEQFGC
jgi:hypothetical protein